VLADDDAEFGYPEVDIGFVPAMVMAILRRKVTESVAFELVTTGERISAERAARIGLVNRMFPAGEFEAGTSRLLETLAKKPASALEISKALLYELDVVGFDEAIRRGAEVNAIARRTDACREGVRRFLDRSRS
jgi:methylglutaconyl-CoA hydratase